MLMTTPPCGTLKVCVIQCPWAEERNNLVQCARYKLIEEMAKFCQRSFKIIVCLVLQLPRVTGGCFIGFQVEAFIWILISILSILFTIFILSDFPCLSLND